MGSSGGRPTSELPGHRCRPHPSTAPSPEQLWWERHEWDVTALAGACADTVTPAPCPSVPLRALLPALRPTPKQAPACFLSPWAALHFVEISEGTSGGRSRAWFSHSPAEAGAALWFLSPLHLFLCSGTWCPVAGRLGCPGGAGSWNAARSTGDSEEPGERRSTHGRSLKSKRDPPRGSPWSPWPLGCRASRGFVHISPTPPTLSLSTCSLAVGCPLGAVLRVWRLAGSGAVPRPAGEPQELSALPGGSPLGRARPGPRQAGLFTPSVFGAEGFHFPDVGFAPALPGLWFGRVSRDPLPNPRARSSPVPLEPVWFGFRWGPGGRGVPGPAHLLDTRGRSWKCQQTRRDPPPRLTPHAWVPGLGGPAALAVLVLASWLWVLCTRVCMHVHACVRVCAHVSLTHTERAGRGQRAPEAGLCLSGRGARLTCLERRAGCGGGPGELPGEPGREGGQREPHLVPVPFSRDFLQLAAQVRFPEGACMAGRVLLDQEGGGQPYPWPTLVGASAQPTLASFTGGERGTRGRASCEPRCRTSEVCEWSLTGGVHHGVQASPA